MTTTVSEKGQITIPKPVRESLGLATGVRLTVEERDGGVVLRKSPTENPIARLFGILPPGDTDAELRAARGPEWDADIDPAVLTAPRARGRSAGRE